MPDRPVIRRSPEILGGTPVFDGTRVPIATLIDYLKTGEAGEAGDRLDDFLREHPSVSRSQALAVMELAKQALLAEGDEATA